MNCRLFLFITKTDEIRSLLRSLERQFLGDNYHNIAPLGLKKEVINIFTVVVRIYLYKISVFILIT